MLGRRVAHCLALAYAVEETIIAVDAAAVDLQLKTYLWIELIDATNSIVYVATLNGSTDDHAIEDAVRIDKRLEAALFAEAVGCVLVALDDKIIHDETVQITALGAMAERQKRDCSVCQIW